MPVCTAESRNKGFGEILKEKTSTAGCTVGFRRNNRAFIFCIFVNAKGGREGDLNTNGTHSDTRDTGCKSASTLRRWRRYSSGGCASPRSTCTSVVRTAKRSSEDISHVATEQSRDSAARGATHASDNGSADNNGRLNVTSSQGVHRRGGVVKAVGEGVILVTAWRSLTSHESIDCGDVVVHRRR